MKSKILYLILIFIIILISISHAVLAIELKPNVFQADDKSITAYAELKEATLSSASGQQIISALVSTESSSQLETISTPVEIVLVIDNSGSMKLANRMINAKEAAKNFVNSAFNGMNSISFDLIYFSSNATILLENSEDKTEILNSIDSINHNGNTHYIQAINSMNEIYEHIKTNRPDKSVYTIFLSDGAPNDPEISSYNGLTYMGSTPSLIYPYFKQQKDDYNSQYYFILLECEDDSAFTGNTSEPIGSIYKNITTSQLSSIYDEIYTAITSNLISGDVTTTLDPGSYYFVSDDILYMIVDNQILTSATLKLTYTINFICIKDCYDLDIVANIDKKLTYDPSLNTTENWTIDTASSDAKGHPVLLLHEHRDSTEEPLFRKGETYTKNISLRCLLSPREDANFKNSIDFKLNNDNSWSGTLETLELNLVPPFGATYNYSFVIIAIPSLLLLVLLLLKFKKQ